MLFIEHLTGLSVTVFAKKNLLCRSVARSSPTLGYPMGCSTPGLPVFHYLPEFAQIKPSESLDVHNFIGCCVMVTTQWDVAFERPTVVMGVNTRVKCGS